MPPLLPPWVTALVSLAAAAAIFYAVVVTGLFVGQGHILFRPAHDRPDLQRAAVPGAIEIAVPAADGLQLLAWFLPPAGEGPTILFLHGNGGHIGHRIERLRRFAAQGWGVLMLEYRGYGGTPGKPSEAELRRDAEAGLAALRARHVPDGRIVLWGESLGSGLVTWLAARLPEGERVGAIVLETPYTSIADIARRRYRFVPVDLLLRHRFESLANMPAIRSPVLVLVGARDTVVPAEMGRAIHAAANPPAELWEAAQGGHVDLMQHGSIEAVAVFLRRHLSSGGR